MLVRPSAIVCQGQFSGNKSVSHSKATHTHTRTWTSVSVCTGLWMLSNMHLIIRHCLLLNSGTAAGILGKNYICIFLFCKNTVLESINLHMCPIFICFPNSSGLAPQLITCGFLPFPCPTSLKQNALRWISCISIIFWHSPLLLPLWQGQIFKTNIRPKNCYLQIYFTSQYNPLPFSTQVSRFVYWKTCCCTAPNLCFPVAGEISFSFRGGRYIILIIYVAFVLTRICHFQQHLDVVNIQHCSILKQFQMQSHIKNTATLAGKQASEQANRQQKTSMR